MPEELFIGAIQPERVEKLLVDFCVKSNLISKADCKKLIRNYLEKYYQYEQQ